MNGFIEMDKQKEWQEIQWKTLKELMDSHQKYAKQREYQTQLLLEQIQRETKKEMESQKSIQKALYLDMEQKMKQTLLEYKEDLAKERMQQEKEKELFTLEQIQKQKEFLDQFSLESKRIKSQLSLEMQELLQKEIYLFQTSQLKSLREEFDLALKKQGDILTSEIKNLSLQLYEEKESKKSLEMKLKDLTESLSKLNQDFIKTNNLLKQNSKKEEQSYDKVQKENHQLRHFVNEGLLKIEEACQHLMEQNKEADWQRREIVIEQQSLKDQISLLESGYADLYQKIEKNQVEQLQKQNKSEEEKKEWELLKKENQQLKFIITEMRKEMEDLAHPSSATESVTSGSPLPTQTDDSIEKQEQVKSLDFDQKKHLEKSELEQRLHQLEKFVVNPSFWNKENDQKHLPWKVLQKENEILMQRSNELQAQLRQYKQQLQQKHQASQSTGVQTKISVMLPKKEKLLAENKQEINQQPAMKAETKKLPFKPKIKMEPKRRIRNYNIKDDE